jgi:hypothetical protein
VKNRSRKRWLDANSSNGGNMAKLTKRQQVLANMAATIYAGTVHNPSNLSLPVDGKTLADAANTILKAVEKL